jgi:2-oxoisovalerate dehydrogenase E1 component
MYNRAEIVDQNFTRFVREGTLPQARTGTNLAESGLRPSEVMDLFESQLICRHLDLIARVLKNKNLTYYTIGSAGHEGNAVFGKVFRYTDMAFLHYRSCALMIQRSKQLPGMTPIYDMMLSFTASIEEPIAGGRHKVFGSLPLNVPPQTSTIASHLPKAVGAALSIQRAKDLGLKATLPSDSVIICNFGDASVNHASALTAINTSCWVAHQNLPIPLVWICEDNGIGISVSTPKGWVETTYGNKPNLNYITCDGMNIFDTYLAAREAEEIARIRRKPVFLHMKTLRLLGHAGSDMETNYRSLKQIEETEFQDPLLHSARHILEEGIASKEEIVQIYEKIRKQVEHVAESALIRPRLATAAEVRETVTACAFPKLAPPQPSETERQELFGREYDKLKTPMHMAKLINTGLHDILLRYKNTLVFGEDVALKGGVYNVTDNLFKKFGPRRVFNSLLDETSILGNAIGMAHNGFLPIPEIQFLAYFHNAEDQIRGEASTLAFFSKGQYTNPIVVRIAGLAYQKGFGGHFHNDNSIAVFRDIPGVIVAIPSNGADAVKMMRTCVREAYENGRVVIFIEPIALYMTRDLHQEGDKGWCFEYPDVDEEIALGDFNVYLQESQKPAKKNMTIITYGNGYYYSRQAAFALAEKNGITTKVIDLRWVSPMDQAKLAEEVKNDSHILVVEECRKTGSFSEYIVSSLVEKLENRLPKIQVVAADDCFIPLGKAAAAGLPKKEEILAASFKLLGIES